MNKITYISWSMLHLLHTLQFGMTDLHLGHVFIIPFGYQMGSSETQNLLPGLQVPTPSSF